MDVYLVRHAIDDHRDPARWPNVEQRPLTARGSLASDAQPANCTGSPPSLRSSRRAPRASVGNRRDSRRGDVAWPTPEQCPALDAIEPPGSGLEVLHAAKNRSAVTLGRRFSFAAVKVARAARIGLGSFSKRRACSTSTTNGLRPRQVRPSTEGLLNQTHVEHLRPRWPRLSGAGVVAVRLGSRSHRAFKQGFSQNGPDRTRTCDLGIKSPLLYQLSYRPSGSIGAGAHRPSAPE